MGQKDHSATHNDQHHHITPFSTYLKVALALFALTFLTIGAHAIRDTLGVLAPFVAFGIAAVKAYLVMAWFMHLKYENMENKIVFATGFFFLGLLFLISFIDIVSRMNFNSIL
ncbi:MAG: cytochrome C oxidase subunit IV family protein [Pseudobdellovibrio sp.]